MRIFWTCFENLFFWNNFYQFACFLLQHTSSDHLIPFECSWNCLSNNVPPSVQLAVDQLPTDEVPHWKAEIWTIVHQAVLVSQSEVLSKTSETDTHRTNVLLGTQTSYIWSCLQTADSVGIGYNRKVSCVKTFKVYANGRYILVFALAAFSSSGGSFSYQKSIPTSVDSSV